MGGSQECQVSFQNMKMAGLPGVEGLDLGAGEYMYYFFYHVWFSFALRSAYDSVWTNPSNCSFWHQWLAQGYANDPTRPIRCHTQECFKLDFVGRGHFGLDSRVYRREKPKLFSQNDPTSQAHCFPVSVSLWRFFTKAPSPHL